MTLLQALTHIPCEQICPLAQATHIAPLEPQALAVGLVTQAPPEQQPLGQEVASQLAPTGGVVATAADTWGLRMGRLGSTCGLNAAACGGVPPSAPAFTNYIDVAVVGSSLSTICLWQPDTNLRRWINISVGGRVRTQP